MKEIEDKLIIETFHVCGLMTEHHLEVNKFLNDENIKCSRGYGEDGSLIYHW